MICPMCGGPLDELHGWAGPGHRERYHEAVAEYELARWTQPDRYWRALLRLTTALPELWRRVRPCLDYRHGEVRIPRGVRRGLSSGEALVLDVALCLFGGRGGVDLSGLADRLDATLFEVVVATLWEFRGRRVVGSLPAATI